MPIAKKHSRFFAHHFKRNCSLHDARRVGPVGVLADVRVF